MLKIISIHAPRGGSDTRLVIMQRVQIHFNPRSPWGERRRLGLIRDRINLFQSTLPVGGATSLCKRDVQLWIFQSTLPVGGATFRDKERSRQGYISIHAPRGGSDQ